MDLIQYGKTLQHILPEPPIVSVCVSAGWTIRRVKERYLKHNNTGDDVVGRILTSISPSCEAGISPVYFSCSQTEESLVEEFVCLTSPIQHIN